MHTVKFRDIEKLSRNEAFVYLRKQELRPDFITRHNSRDEKEQALNQAKRFYEDAKKYGSKEQRQNAEYFYIRAQFRLTDSAAISLIESLPSRADRMNESKNFFAEVNYKWEYILCCFRYTQEYEMAFEKMLELENQLSRLTVDEVPNLQFLLYYMALRYYDFLDFEKSIQLMHKALLHKDLVENTNFQILNSIGLCYSKLGKNDSAIQFFDLGLVNLNNSKSHSQNYHVWTNIIQGNIGETYLAKGNTKKALPLILQDLNNARKNGPKTLLANALTNLAKINLLEGEMSAAYTHINEAKLLLPFTTENLSRLDKTLSVLVEVLKANGEYKLASIYQDSLLLVRTTINNQYSSTQVLRGKQRAALNQKRHLEAETKARTMQRNILFFGILCILICIAMFYYNLRKKRAQKELIQKLQFEKQQQQLENQKRELEQFEQRLLDFSHSISEKNKMVENAIALLNDNDRTSTIEVLQRSTILTDSEWDSFKNLFNQVHSGFLIRLKEKYPDVSPAETRFLVLSKLGFSNKEMANTLGVNMNTIRVTQFRLRKKMNLLEENALENWLEKI